MDPQNNQTNQGVNVTQNPSVQNQSQESFKQPSGSNNFLILGISGGIIVVVLLGLFSYFYFSSKSTTTNETSSLPKVTSVPVPVAKEEESSVASVNGASDLDQLLIEVVQADNSLEKELKNLEKDSNF